MYKLDVLTNSFPFLVELAIQTGALIKPLDFAEQNSFQLCYDNIDCYHAAKKYLDALLRKAVS